MLRRLHFQDPPIVSTPLDDDFAVIVPKARTNEISNPSAETNTTGYTAGAGSLARSTAQQYHGAYSLAYTPSATTTDGFYYTFTSTVALRAVSCKFLGDKGRSYALAYSSTAPSELVTYTFTATGRWQWIWLYMNETSATSRRIYFRKNGGTNTATFYVDGVQSEVLSTAADRVSTYIDGDQLGLVPNQSPVAYVWNGTPHASTSARSGLTRAGGEVVKFTDFGFTLIAIIGLGLAQPQNVATEYARIDGGYDDYTRKPTRQFTITGRFDGRSYQELRDNRGGLAQLLDRDLIGQDQRLVLLHQVLDPCGNIDSNTSRLLCKYQDGMGGNTDSVVAQNTPITFTQYLPNVTSDAESGSALSVQTNIASNANGVLQRSAAGVWSSLANVTAGFGVYSMVRGLDGLIYMGGDFTPNPGACVVSWNPVTGAFSSMGTGAAGGFVYQLAMLPSGNIVAVGTFTSMGGVANTNRIAMWTPSTGLWSSISNAWAGTELRTAAVSAAGILYVGGNGFTINGVAVNSIAQWNPNTTTWSAVGAGTPASVTSIVTVGTTIYAAVEANGIYKSTGGNFTAIGATAGGDADSVAVDAAGNIYAAGAFTSIGGVTAARIAKYNGVAWFPLGTGLNNGVNLRALSFDQRGLLYVGGDFTTAGGITTPTGSAIWNGSAWVYSDIIPAATAHMYQALAVPNGVFYQGTINGGSATGPGVTTITNPGTARSYPTITIQGPSSGTSRIYSIFNATTGRNIWLNLTISAGETVTMVFQPDNLSFISTFQGNIAGSILAGSNTADFFLQPGANSIAFLSASSTVTATLSFRPAYVNLDDVP